MVFLHMWPFLLAVTATIPLIACTTSHLADQADGCPEPLAVGFDVTPTGAYASIRHPEWGILPVGIVSASPAFTSLIHRLDLPSSRHMAPPYQWFPDGGALAGISDLPRQLLRRGLKSIGLPASADVAVIAELLSATKAMVEAALEGRSSHVDLPRSCQGTKIKNIVLSSPVIAALYDEDLVDAAEHAGLTLLSNKWFERQPKHAFAALSATSLSSDVDYERDRPWRFVMAHLTTAGMEVSCEIKSTNRTCELGWAQHRSYFDSSIGLPPLISSSDALEPGPEKHTIWRERIKSLVQKCMQREFTFHHTDNVTDILFAGMAGESEPTRDAVVDAVTSMQPSTPRIWPQHLMSTAFTASAGATKMAWEILTRPDDGGEDSGECFGEQNRKRDGGDWGNDPYNPGHGEQTEVHRADGWESRAPGVEL